LLRSAFFSLLFCLLLLGSFWLLFSGGVRLGSLLLDRDAAAAGGATCEPRVPLVAKPHPLLASPLVCHRWREPVSAGDPPEPGSSHQYHHQQS
jgi:hypothetical protein